MADILLYIDGGDVFEGTIAQWENNFGGLTGTYKERLAYVKVWCRRNNYALVIKGEKMASSGVPTFEQVKEFFKNISDEQIAQIKTILQEKDDIHLTRKNTLTASIKRFYPELYSLWNRGERLVAIKFIKDNGFTHKGVHATFSAIEVKNALDEALGVPDTIKEENEQA